MVQYPITLTPDDNDTIFVTFPDFPEATTFGVDREEAIARAADALETVIDAYISDRRPIPAPSQSSATRTKADTATVPLPPLVAIKVQIYTAMQRQQVNKTALAKRLNVHLPQVDRLLDLKHGSKIQQLEAAAQALGGHLDIILVVPDGDPLVVESKRNRPNPAGMLRLTKGAGRTLAPRAPRPVNSRSVHAAMLAAALTSDNSRSAKASKKR